MADNTISSRLELDGEREYRQALNDAYRSLRVLRSELKAESAELGRNASEQDKARKKADSLKKQIQEQEKIVKTLQKALADSKNEYSENQAVQDKWEEKLNKAREALAKMRSDLDGTEESLKRFSSGMKATADDTGNAVNTVQTLKDGLTSIKDIFTGIGSAVSGTFTNSLDTIEEFVEQVITLMSKAWTAASDWDQIRAMFGGDISEIQAIYTGMGLQGVDPSGITSGIQKLITNTHNGSKETTKALKKLGIEEKDYNSHWDYYMAVMDKLAMYRGAEQDKLARALFGEREGSRQDDVLANWQEAKNKYEDDVEATGLHLSSEQLDQLDEVSHKITEIQELWNRIQLNVGAKLSEVLNMDQLSDDTLTLLRDLGSIFSGNGDQKELVIKFSEDLETFVTDVEGAMRDLSAFLDDLSGELKDSENPLLQFIGRLIDALSGFITFLEQNGDTILAWLESMLPMIAANKVSEAMTGKGIGDWASDLGQGVVNLIVGSKLISGLRGLGGAAAGAAGAAGAGAAGAGIGGWLSGLWATASGWIGNAAGAVSGVNPAVGLIPTVLGDTTELGRTLRDGGTLGDALDASGKAIQGWAEDVQKNAQQWWTMVSTPVENAWDAYVGAIDSFLFPDVDDPRANRNSAIENMYDKIRLGGNIELARGILDEFTTSEEQTREIMRRLEQFVVQTRGGVEDLPSDFFQDLDIALSNLAKDKYNGDEKESQEIVINVTANTYLDGDLISQEVSRNMYGGLNHHWISQMSR